MGIIDWLRESLTGQKICPIEHLESYKRLGEQVYGLHVELKDCEHTRALAYLQAAKSLQIMADSLLGDVFSSFGGAPKSVPVITHEQADVWYGQIPDLLVAARQEAAFANAAQLKLPITLGMQMEGPSPCPVDHIAGLRRAADELEKWLGVEVEGVRRNGDQFKAAILLYEEARTRKQAGDSIVGTITNGRRVSAESHEDAEEQYWMALSNYILVAQGLKDPGLLKPSGLKSLKTCKLDSNDIWKVTSQLAIREIKRAGEENQAIEDLIEHWDHYRMSEDEHNYECTVEELLQKGQITETAYWYCCPFPSVYRVVHSPIRILGKEIPTGHVFVYEYGDDGLPGRFITRDTFQKTDTRKYCED